MNVAIVLSLNRYLFHQLERNKIWSRPADGEDFVCVVPFKTGERKTVSYVRYQDINERKLENSIDCLGKDSIHIRNKFDFFINGMSLIPKEHINLNDYDRIHQRLMKMGFDLIYDG